jgi:hypothetical protein
MEGRGAGPGSSESPGFGFASGWREEVDRTNHLFRQGSIPAGSEKRRLPITATSQLDTVEHLFYTQDTEQMFHSRCEERTMAQRQDPIQADVRSSRGWLAIIISLCLLLLIAPGLPASLSIAGGVALIVLLGCILYEDGQHIADRDGE